MPKMIFVNLPVADVEKSAAFYKAVGFTKDERFSRPGSAAAMKWSDTIIFMLLSREHFAQFTSKTIIDARSSVETLLCLSRDSRAEVDAIVEAARAAGGKADPGPTQDHGFMYGRASRTSTAMSSSRCGWISRPRLPPWAAIRPPDTAAFRRRTHV